MLVVASAAVAALRLPPHPLPRGAAFIAMEAVADMEGCDDECRSGFMDEHNAAHGADVWQIAKRINDEDGVDWSVEELSAVRIVAVDATGITVEEILCSSVDQRCLAVPLHVRWPATSPCPRTAAEMRQAFAELSLRAFADESACGSLPPVYEAQQRQLDSAMALMNAQFGRLLKYYALRLAREAFAPSEQLERATLTQLNFEGLSLACETLLLGDEAFGDKLERRRWSTSVLFDSPCATAEEVEDRLVAMFAEAEEPRERWRQPVARVGAERRMTAARHPADGRAGGPRAAVDGRADRQAAADVVGPAAQVEERHRRP